VLAAAAVCPHPPLLIPEAMGAAGHAATAGDSWIPELRAACGLAVATLAAASPDLLVVVGGAARTAVFEASAAGNLLAFGIPYTIGTGEPVLPLSLTAGRWLLRPGFPDCAVDLGFSARKINHVNVVLQAVRQSLPAKSCLRLGAELAARAPRVALLAMGDGSARKAVGVPGAADPAADGYHADVAAALAGADPARLARLDPGLDQELMVAGRAAWQVLAGAAAAGGQLRGQLHYAAAPLGVSYLVASWARG
jgi:hypothetical protein